MGLSGDLKFGSGTIGAATSKYGNSFNASGFKGYTNPVKKSNNGQPSTENKVVKMGNSYVTVKDDGKLNYWDVYNSMPTFR